MAFVINNTARQFNLRCIDKKLGHVVVRLVPGANNVEDIAWGAFVNDKKTDAYVKELSDKKFITYGEKAADLEFSINDEDIVEAVVKKSPMPK